MAAAGSGQRLGAGGPKAFVELGGRPLIEWSLLALAAAESIAAVVIAAPPGGEGEAEEALRRVGGEAGATVIAGGATRAESVALALEHVDTEIVAIHDAARPLIEAELVDRVVARLTAEPQLAGVIAAAPIADTIKRSAEGRSIAETLSREELWAAQTPQAFRAEPLRDAQHEARADGRLESATDEAQLIEWTGGRVLLEASGAPNLKVTDAADLAVVARLLAARDVGTDRPAT